MADAELIVVCTPVARIVQHVQEVARHCPDNALITDAGSVKAEIVSAIAVVAGLLFVGLQIRQSTEQAALNTRALEVSAYQDLIGQLIDINLATMTDPELTDITLRARAGPLTDEIERARAR